MRRSNSGDGSRTPQLMVGYDRRGPYGRSIDIAAAIHREGLIALMLLLASPAERSNKSGAYPPSALCNRRPNRTF